MTRFFGYEGIDGDTQKVGVYVDAGKRVWVNGSVTTTSGGYNFMIPHFGVNIYSYSPPTSPQRFRVVCAFEQRAG